MLILHAALVNDTLAVWGEEPRGCATTERFRTALGAIGGESWKLTGWLPTAAGRPAPSSPLIGEAVPIEKTRIAPWPIEAIVVDDTIELLASVVGKRLIAPGVVVGADLAFLATAMRFAAALVSRGHVLPSLESRGTEWLAPWTAAPTAGEHEQMASLVRALPPVVLAFGTSDDAPPAVDRRAAVETFVTSIIDRLMRTHARAPQSRDSLHDRWVVALSTPDARVDGDPAELAALRQTLAEWRRPVSEQALFDFRIAFRLEEPPLDGERWTIRFLLQGVEDPSLMCRSRWSGRATRAAPMPRRCGVSSVAGAAMQRVSSSARWRRPPPSPRG